MDEIRPDIGVPHHVPKKSCRTSATLSQPFTIRSRETYRFHGSDPFTKEAWSMHFSPRRLAPVCVCVSSFPRSFSSLRIVSRTIEYPAWVVEPARIVFLEKALPFLRCYFLFVPFKSVNETRKLAFVGAANSKGGCANAFLYAPLFMTGLPLWIISEWRHFKLLVYSWMIQEVWFFWNL